MRRIGIAACALLAAVGAGAAGFGSSAVGTTAGRFLDLGAGARAMALGGAYSAAADEASALYWNPAAMTQVRRRSATLMHAAYLADSSYDYGSYVHNAKRTGAFGLGLQYFSFGTVFETDEGFHPTGTSHPYDLAVSAGYAREFKGGAAVGLAGKFIQSKLAETATTGAVDAGVLSPRLFSDRLRLAAVVRNAGGSLKYGGESDPLPLAFKLGGVLRLTDAWILALDLDIPRSDDPGVRMGTEYMFVDESSWRFAGRAGFSSADVSPAAGIGIGVRGLTVDYAFVPYSGLGYSGLGEVHRISLTFDF